MSASKPRKRPTAASIHETLVNSPYLGKSGAGVPRVRQVFHPAPSKSEIFRGFIDPKYAVPKYVVPIMGKKRPKQPNYRAPTFTSLNRKADISNVLKSQTVPSSMQKSQTANPAFPAKRQKSVIETSDLYSRETYNLVELMDTGSPRNKTSQQRKRGDHKAASAKGSAIIRTPDGLENVPAHDEVRGRRPATKKRKVSSGKTVDDLSSFVNGAAANEIADFLGSPHFKSDRADSFNKRALKERNINKKYSSTGIPPVLKMSSVVLSPGKDPQFDDIFSPDHPSPSPKHEYPILDETKEAQSREAMNYVQNALSAWINFKESITPVVSNTNSKSCPNESKKLDPVPVTPKLSVAKTVKATNSKKKKPGDSRPVSRGNISRSENLVASHVDNNMAPSIQNLKNTDINGNEIGPITVDVPTGNTQEEIMTLEMLPAKKEFVEEPELSQENIPQDIQNRGPAVVAMTFASISTQMLVSSIPIGIQVGKSLMELDKTVTVEEDCQTETSRPETEEFEEKELISVWTQTCQFRRKKSSAPCPPKLKTNPSFKIPFAGEGEKHTSVDTIMELKEIEILTLVECVPTTGRDINNNETEVHSKNESEYQPNNEPEDQPNNETEDQPNNETEDQLNNETEDQPNNETQDQSNNVIEDQLNSEGYPTKDYAENEQFNPEADQQEIAENWIEESNIPNNKGSSFPFLNGQISTVGCTAPVSEGSDSKGDFNCNSCEDPVRGVGYVKSCEHDVVPLIRDSNQGDPSGRTVGVSGIPKTWSLTSYNHPFQNQCLGQQFPQSSVTSIACDSPGFAASTQTLNETHAECQVGSSFKLYPLAEYEQPPNWTMPVSDSSDNFLNPDSLLKMSDNVRQVITDLDLGTNIENTLETITKTFSALSEIVSDLVNPDDVSVEVSSEEEILEPKSVVPYRDVEMGLDAHSSQLLQVMENVCCSLDPTLSETTY
ncbi:unnamed protein product [Allacma fusca]|uniref:Uncharacterized protein n=1 Tax=Allacma fusca TaxID=39272 RepID=A0A8J2KRB0_9HEXA|nr:unnamed protein product [Allacma fusca]